MRLYCKACGVAVTNELQEITDPSVLDKDAYGKDYVPKGLYYHSKKLLPKWKEVGIVVNNNDVINCQYHEERGRLNGCCGQDGLDGLNRVCVNGHEIATERSDCWTYHYTRFDPEAVKFVD